MEVAFELGGLRIEWQVAAQMPRDRRLMLAHMDVPEFANAVVALFGDGNPNSPHERIRDSADGNFQPCSDTKNLSVDHAPVGAQNRALLTLRVGHRAPGIGLIEREGEWQRVVLLSAALAGPNQIHDARPGEIGTLQCYQI